LGILCVVLVILGVFGWFCGLCVFTDFGVFVCICGIFGVLEAIGVGIIQNSGGFCGLY